MDDSLFLFLEDAITIRNPFLARRLKSGLPETTIRNLLNQGNVTGEVESIIKLYSWHNGTATDEETPMEKTSFFPLNIFQFIDLENAIEQFAAMSFATEHLDSMLEATAADGMFSGFGGLCFPVFSNGGTGSIAVDLSSGERNRVFTIEFESLEPLTSAYDTFEDFIQDAINANREGKSLTCFQ